jgi:hypothetical protein
VRADVAAVRDLIARRFPDALPEARHSRPVVPTGLAALDAALPGGGLPRGRLTAWAPGLGAAAILRAACAATVAGGERAVWIDAVRVRGGGWQSGPLLVRPTDAVEALRAAETLARSGGFALVVLDTAAPVDSALVRLARAAHEGGGALVALAEASGPAALRVSTRPRLAAYGWRHDAAGGAPDVRSVQVTVDARTSGWRATAELSIPVRHDDLRLCVVRGTDRRGVGRGAGGTGAARPRRAARSRLG